jgi:hypothetical protein
MLVSALRAPHVGLGLGVRLVVYASPNPPLKRELRGQPRYSHLTKQGFQPRSPFF